MRRNRLLALAVSTVALGLGAGPAMADAPLSAQLAEQVAANGQAAQSSANSTQVAPTNQNISVRVLSPGDNGSVDQSNTSAAESYAGNLNSTEQAVEQDQSGGGGTAIQEAAQKAGNQQWADSTAESTQIKPKNQNISVRVLSEGDDGDVTQSNDSSAKSGALNANELSQDVDQSQEGGECCSPSKEPEYSRDKGHDDGGCCHGAVGIQAAGQEAYSKQAAQSSAHSKQVEPKNSNLSVRVLSEGDDGDVTQSNESAAFSKALNKNDTDQSIDQSQEGSDCGCYGGVGIQAAGQKALNWQAAQSDATSEQFHPSNYNDSLRFKSEGDGGDVTQSNASFAGSFAVNWNDLEQAVEQEQGD